MRRVFGGAALVILGIAAFIEAHSHAPVNILACRYHREECGLGGESRYEIHLGLSQTAYDLLRIGAWALVIVGGLLVIVGLIDRWRRVPA